jgi:chromosome segregation ATPase
MSVNYGELSSNTQSVESRFIAVWDDLNTALPTSVTGKLSGRIKAIEDEISTTNPNSKLETLKRDIETAKTDINALKKEVDPDDPASALGELSTYAKKNRQDYDAYVSDRLYTDE